MENMSPGFPASAGGWAVTQRRVTRAAAHKQTALSAPGARGSRLDRGQARRGRGDPGELVAVPGPFPGDEERFGMPKRPWGPRGAGGGEVRDA